MFETARALLADAWQRHNCEAVVARNGHYYTGPASRETIKDALQILRDRQHRRSCRGIAEKARQGTRNRILLLRDERARTKNTNTEVRWRNRIVAGKTGLSTVRKTFRRPDVQKRFLDCVGNLADGAIRLIAQAVGYAGEQMHRDIRELSTSEDFSGKQGRHHRYDKTTIDRLQIMPDWSAVLVTMRDYVSFGSGGANGYEKRGGNSYRCYLIVRDSTTGEGHILRVPPKYGNAETQFFSKFESQTGWGKRLKLRTAEQRRIHAAVAWTFSLKPHEYNPEVQA
jgi:hypothetical protein